MEKEVSRHSIFTPNNRWFVLTVVLFVSSVLFACGGVKGKFTSTGISYKQSGKQLHEILLLFPGDRPSRPYTGVGRVTTDWFWKGATAHTSEVFEALKKAAAQSGLDGVMDIRCASAGTMGEGLCSGNGFVFK